MKTWYKAVCHEHMEMIHVFVNDVYYTDLYLSDHNDDIGAWMSLHYGCDLELVHRDDRIGEFYDAGYTDPIRMPCQRR